ncbi:hypothetical protein GCM10018785_45060 [Streptomyces longispororuber]|uniref:Pyrrolo-quinoline quinone repeat domain-containing protein n=1 Tax=Streptomyces longispororuber TaxID=68230 RepID=A0A918ZWC8_9ACTN|nr:PQQ-binding-like beta-propeller repeat protein [Streptomyces longispororuber]GHE71796.1 hypothetical protein GCM10018785_45060 [Streptomyces longispororuber]
MPERRETGGRPWGPLRGEFQELNELAVLLRGWVDEARLGVEGLRGKLTPEHFASGRVPAKATLSAWLSGKGLRWEFVEAVADACSASHPALESRLARARPLWQRYQQAPTPAAAGPEHAEAGRKELLRAQRRIIDLQEQLARAHHAYSDSQQALAHAVPLAILLSQMVGRLTAQIDALRARPAASLGDLDLARDQLHHAQSELARAQAQRDEAQNLARTAESRVEELEQTLRTLRVSPAAPEDTALVVPARSADPFTTDMGHALEKARIVNEFTQTLTQAARDNLAPPCHPAVPDNPDNPVTRAQPANNPPLHGREAMPDAGVTRILVQPSRAGHRPKSLWPSTAVRLWIALVGALLLTVSTLVLNSDAGRPGSAVLLYVSTADAVEAVHADTGRRQWRYASRGDGWRDMASARGTLFVSDIDGHVDALDTATGTRRWRVTVPRGEHPPQITPPQITRRSSTLYIIHPNNGLIALDARTGTRRWTAADVDEGVPVRATGHAVYAVRDNRLSKLDASTGKPRWNYRLDHSDVANTVVVHGNTVYLCLDQAVVIALDAATGKQRWSSDLNSAPGSPRGKGLSAIASRDTVYVGGASAPTSRVIETPVIALDAATGKQRWSFPSGASSSGYATMQASDVVLMLRDGQKGSKSAAFALDAATGKQRWGIPGSGWFGLPAVAGDTVYLTSFERSLALDVATGKEHWRFPDGNPVPQPETTDHTVYIAGNPRKGKRSHQVYALDSSTGRKRWNYRATAAIESLWLPSTQ